MPRWIPGLAVALAGAAAGFGVHALLPFVPWLTASLVLGVVVACIPPVRPALDGMLKPGLSIAARRVLRLGIVVLGLKLSLGDIAQLGWRAVLIIIALVGVSFVITWGIARMLRLPGDEPVLMAAGYFGIVGPRSFGGVFLVHGVLSGCYFTGAAALAQVLMPKLKFAVYYSAYVLLWAVGNCVVGLGFGKLLDLLDRDYRFAFAAGGVIAALAFWTGWVVYRRFMALGGPKGYTAPE